MWKLLWILLGMLMLSGCADMGCPGGCYYLFPEARGITHEVAMRNRYASQLNPYAFQQYMMLRSAMPQYQPLPVYQMPTRNSINCNTWQVPGQAWGSINCQ